MKFGSLVKVLAMVSAIVVIGTGCGGMYATRSFSPLMFLLPGLAQNKPGLPTPPVTGQTITNQILARAY